MSVPFIDQMTYTQLLYNPTLIAMTSTVTGTTGFGWVPTTWSRKLSCTQAMCPSGSTLTTSGIQFKFGSVGSSPGLPTNKYLIQETGSIKINVANPTGDVLEQIDYPLAYKASSSQPTIDVSNAVGVRFSGVNISFSTSSYISMEQAYVQIFVTSRVDNSNHFKLSRYV